MQDAGCLKLDSIHDYTGILLQNAFWLPAGKIRVREAKPKSDLLAILPFSQNLDDALQNGDSRYARTASNAYS